MTVMKLIGKNSVSEKAFTHADQSSVNATHISIYKIQILI